MNWARISQVLVCVCAVVIGRMGLSAGTNGPGSVTEVREGDQWTKATIVRAEGRKTLIRYDDGSEEWVTAERLRNASPVVAAGHDESGKAGDTGKGGQVADAGGKSFLRIGAEVEFKRGHWMKGSIIRGQRGWYLIKEEHGQDSYWCEPWAIREIGGEYDLKGWGVSRGAARLGESAPFGPPGPSPDAKSGGTGSRALAKIDVSGALDPQPGNNASMALSPTTRPARDFIAATVHPKIDYLAGVIVCRDTPETAILCFGGRYDEALDVMRVDTRTGRQVDYRTVGKNYRIVGAADSGKTLLAFPKEGFAKQMHLLALESGAYKIKESYDFLGQEFGHINFACLIDATHAVYRDSDGNCYLLDLAGKRATGFIRTLMSSQVYVSPDGQVLGVITGSRTALLIRTRDFSIIGEFREAGGTGRVVVDPTGEMAAYLTGERSVRVVKVSDGSTVANFAVASSGDLDMPSPGIVLVDHLLAYDATTGIPVWIYSLPAVSGVCKARLAGGQTLFCSVTKNTADVCIAMLPDGPARNALKAVSKDAFMLSPGMAVRLNRNFGQFGDEAEKVAELVSNSIKSAGLELSEKQEPIEVSVSVGAGPSESREYASGRGPRMGPFGMPFGGEVASYTVPSTIVTVQMAHDGKPVWSQEFRFQASGQIEIPRGKNVQDVINEAAKPKAAGMGALAIPGYLPRGAVPGAPPALGASELTPRGFAPAPKTSPKPAPGNRSVPAPVPTRNNQTA